MPYARRRTCSGRADGFFADHTGRSRTVPLSADGAEFFEQLTAGRPGDAPVFVRDSGGEWTRMQVSRSMQRKLRGGEDRTARGGPRPTPFLWLAAAECRRECRSYSGASGARGYAHDAASVRTPL